MGCCFACFRAKDSNANIVTPQEPVVPRSKNALSSLFLSDDSIRKSEEGRSSVPSRDEVRELKDEAKILKDDGTLAETPIDIGKASEKQDTVLAQNGEEKSSKLNSVLFNASVEKLEHEKLSDETSIPVKICEESVTGSGSMLESPRSCMTDRHSTGRVRSSSIQRSDILKVITPINMRDGETHSETSSVSSQVLIPGEQCKNKPVWFDNESDMLAVSSEQPKQPVSVDHTSITKPSPNVNPLKLSYDMENLPSLSDWLKPPSAKQYGNNKQFGPAKDVGDRPILGMVAAHWNDDETSHFPPKWWDGNGIPNSTNKYKEDQKVSWHATPFEERLEKALSEETSISQRKPISGAPPVDFNETEESDTALSRFQSSANLKSVVSF